MTTQTLKKLLPIALLLGTAACGAEDFDIGSETQAIEADCVVRADISAFDLDAALVYFKWNGTIHASMGENRLRNRITSFEDKLAATSSADKITKFEARIAAGKYMLSYKSDFHKEGVGYKRKLVKNFDVDAKGICDDGGCAAGALESDTLIHHGYRSFAGRDASSAEISSALALLPDASDSDFDATAAYQDELISFTRETFIHSEPLCDADNFGYIAGGYNEFGVVVPSGTLFVNLAPLRQQILGFALEPTRALDGSIDFDLLFPTAESPSSATSVEECHAIIDRALDEAFRDGHYLDPSADEYRYNLNPSATPWSCPKPRVR